MRALKTCVCAGGHFLNSGDALVGRDTGRLGITERPVSPYADAGVWVGRRGERGFPEASNAEPQRVTGTG